jgi:hypothetical protein
MGSDRTRRQGEVIARSSGDGSAAAFCAEGDVDDVGEQADREGGVGVGQDYVTRC